MKDSNFTFTYATWKVSKYGVFSGSYFPVFSPNTENTDQKKHRIWTLFTKCRVRKPAERGKVWTQNFKHKRRAWNKVIAKSKKITISLSLSYKKHLCPFSLRKRQNCFKLSVVEFFFPNGIQLNMGFLREHFWKFW